MTRILSLFFIVGLVVSPLCANGAQPSNKSVPVAGKNETIIISPKEIIAAVKSKGANQVMVQLFKTHAWEKQVYPGISSGDKQWLEVAEKLKPGADGEGGESLSDALSLALLKQPSTTLVVLKKLWWMDTETCYFGWDSEFPNDMSVGEYVKQLEQVLKKNSSKESAELRAECLKGIEKTRKELRQKKQ